MGGPRTVAGAVNRPPVAAVLKAGMAATTAGAVASWRIVSPRSRGNLAGLQDVATAAGDAPKLAGGG
jgi:hypothetical protein